MKLFLGFNPSDSSHLWKEWQIQSFIVMELRRAGFLVAGDMNAGKRNPRMARAQGILAGEPDLRVYLPGSRTALFELKTARGGLSATQRIHHANLARHGHMVHVVFAASPSDGLIQVLAILRPIQ